MLRLGYIPLGSSLVALVFSTPGFLVFCFPVDLPTTHAMSNIESSTPNPTRTFISDEKIFSASGHRGPITSVPVLPASCTETLTRKQISGEDFYPGHYNAQWHDTACYPSDTLGHDDLASTDWKFYYCRTLFPASATPPP